MAIFLRRRWSEEIDLSTSRSIASRTARDFIVDRSEKPIGRRKRGGRGARQQVAARTHRACYSSVHCGEATFSLSLLQNVAQRRRDMVRLLNGHLWKDRQ